MANEATFTMDLTAESGERYTGPVRVLKRLTRQQSLRLDALRRELLGPNPFGATEDVLMSSLRLATCSVHILEAPSWYTGTNRGLNLLDEEPLEYVYNKIMELRDEDRKALEAKAQEAAAELKEG